MSRLDLSLLAPPPVVETLDYEAALAGLIDKLVERLPDCAPIIDLESEPLRILAEAIAYGKTNDRARVNDAARALMLAYSVGADLDHLGALVDTPRLDGEDDTRLRARIQQAFNRLGSAGPANAYKQHALSVAAAIVDVDVFSEAPGQVTLAVLARETVERDDTAPEAIAIGTALFGTPADPTLCYTVAAADSPLLRAVLVAVNAEDVRPLTDAVIVRPPDILTYTVSATLEVLKGPDPETVRAKSLAALSTYLASVTRLSVDVTTTGLIDALFESGTKAVRLATPAADLVRLSGQIAVCLGVTVTVEVVDA